MCLRSWGVHIFWYISPTKATIFCKLANNSVPLGLTDLPQVEQMAELCISKTSTRQRGHSSCCSVNVIGRRWEYLYIFPPNTILMCDQCLVLLLAPAFPVANRLQVILSFLHRRPSQAITKSHCLNQLRPPKFVCKIRENFNYTFGCYHGSISNKRIWN